MDRTLLKLEVLRKNIIGIKDEFDTNFSEFVFDFKSGVGKHNIDNHVVLSEGDAFSNKSGVVFTFKGMVDDTVCFHIRSWHAYYPSVDTDICVRPGVVGVYLDASEISTIGAKAIYNIDKSTEEYVQSRFNKVPKIEFGIEDLLIYDVHKDVFRIHDGVERLEENKLYIEKPSYEITYMVHNSKFNLISLRCRDEENLPTLYKELCELAYKLSVNAIPNIDKMDL